MLHNDTGHRRGYSDFNGSSTTSNFLWVSNSSILDDNKISDRGSKAIQTRSREKFSINLGTTRKNETKVLTSGFLAFLILSILSFSIASQLNYKYDNPPQIVTKARP